MFFHITNTYISYKPFSALTCSVHAAVDIIKVPLAMVRVVGARESRGVGRTLAAREPEQVGFLQHTHANHQAVARLHREDSNYTFFMLP